MPIEDLLPAPGVHIEVDLKTDRTGQNLYFWVNQPQRAGTSRWLACTLRTPMNQIRSECLWSTPAEALAMATALAMAVDWLNDDVEAEKDLEHNDTRTSG